MPWTARVTPPNAGSARARTLASLLKSVATGVIVTIAVLMILSELNLDITPIWRAPASRASPWVSARRVWWLFPSGLFMIFEDQYGVGDTINLGEAVGVVEAVSLRVTRLRDASGNGVDRPQRRDPAGG